MSSIFISYSHNDKAFARKLATDLRNANHTVWIDETDISVGDSIIEKLSDAIKNVDFVVAIISSASVNSHWVQRELDLASNRELNENRIVLLPVLLNDVQLPGFLYGKFYLDFGKKDNYQECLVKLLEKLETNSTLSTPQNISFDKILLKPYLFVETEAHSWLRVPLSELNELDISGKITVYSYMDNLYAYLEEDCDLITFIEAKERRNGHSYEVERDACTVFVNNDEFSSFCNRLLTFETSTPKLKNKQAHRKLYAILMSVAAIATILALLFGDNIWGRISKIIKSKKPAAKQSEMLNVPDDLVDVNGVVFETRPTADEIIEEIKKLPPYDRPAAGENYKGRTFKWRLRFKSLGPVEGKMRYVICNTSSVRWDVVFYINTDAKENLKIKKAKEDDFLDVSGEIERISLVREPQIKLKDVRLEFFD